MLRHLTSDTRHPEAGIRHPLLIAHCALCIMHCALSASAKTVYVTPTGAGDKDGTSWGNAFATLADAYAAAAEGATAGNPGEVWMKKGWYLNASAVITMQPHVKVIGGFNGDETAASQADPDSNWSIVCGNWYAVNPAKYYWKDDQGNNVGGIWSQENGEYTYHPFPQDGGHYHANDCGNVGIFVDTGSSADGNEFRGIVFTGASKNAAIGLKETATAARVVVRDCLFIGGNGYTGNSEGSVESSGDASVTIEGCRFEGCNTAVRLLNTVAAGVYVVSNCQFASCYAKSGTGSGVNTSGAGEVLVADCFFDHGWTDSNQPAIDILAQAAHSRIRNCTFADSLCKSGYGTPSITVYASNIKVDIERCRFVRIRSTLDRDAYSAAACIKDSAAITGASAVVRDCYFEDNELVASGSPTQYRSIGSVYGTQSGNYHSFVNCTMVSNRLVSSTTTSPYRGTISGTYSNVQLLFANCLLKDNDVLQVDGSTTNRLAEINWAGNNSSHRSMVNTILCHAAGDYIPFSSAPNGVAAVCIPGFSFGNYSAFKIQPLLNCDPKLAPGPATKNGLTSWGVAKDSPCRKGGLPIWAGDDRQFYLYENSVAATPWLNLNTFARLGDGDAAAVHVQSSAAPVADAFGEARTRSRIALGPLNTPSIGTVIGVR